MKDTGELCGPRTDRGYNQTTASGYPFWVLDPRPEDIRIEDIAAHLSRICRFGGALREYVIVPDPDSFSGHGVTPVFVETYSVAQHSVLVSRNVPQEFALEALLHDAAEAYVGDVIKPIKLLLEPDWDEIAKLAGFGDVFAATLCFAISSFSRIEGRVDAAIRTKFGLPLEMSPEVKEADYRAVLTEHRDLQIDRGLVDWGFPSTEPWSERIVPVLPSVARAQFLQRFNELYEGEK